MRHARAARDWRADPRAAFRLRAKDSATALADNKTPPDRTRLDSCSVCNGGQPRRCDRGVDGTSTPENPSNGIADSCEHATRRSICRIVIVTPHRRSSPRSPPLGGGRRVRPGRIGEQRRLGRFGRWPRIRRVGGSTRLLGRLSRLWVRTTGMGYYRLPSPAAYRPVAPVVYPAPVYVAPRPVYVAPRPVYVRRRPLRYYGYGYGLLSASVPDPVDRSREIVRHEQRAVRRDQNVRRAAPCVLALQPALANGS